MIRYTPFAIALALLSACGWETSEDEPVVAPEPPAVPSGDPVARAWNEDILEAIRGDFARPTVHARNLWHTSAAMYDAWAAYSDTASTYLLGKTVDGYTCGLADFPKPTDIEGARAQAISHAVYRILIHRFESSPGAEETTTTADQRMSGYGYNSADTSTDYQTGSAAALGNYIADCYINFGLQDGSNEANEYANVSYAPVNTAIFPEDPGNPNITDLDRWQPILLSQFIDQSGNVLFSNEPEFLSPEWGQVTPFALTADDLTTYTRDGFDYLVYHDPGAPPYFSRDSAEAYKWGFAVVAIWSGHLDPTDNVMIDISPASLGNIESFPTTLAEYQAFYQTLEGGDSSQGYTTNPVTGQPYEPQMVPRGDYTRVLAEFWADGPDSETPPGHWFVITNEVFSHELFERRFQGNGDELNALEWYVKAYFALGGAMHDSAIAAWGVKGYYDYLRPVSAIRAMADRGQSSDSALASYNVDGIPLEPGYVELVETGDPLAGTNDENVGKIKVYGWLGPDEITDPATDTAGVGWILAENWWPYQRPTFVSPPFAGYVSGHSTYSRAAAEVLTLLTGSEYFPGGMSGFEISANDFLVFEQGPSVDLVLQWATYRDASDQTSLSRIWGGIHPPADDIPGRIIGEQVGIDAFNRALNYFNGTL